jgi:iron complex outermembrane recepter protein
VTANRAAAGALLALVCSAAAGSAQVPDTVGIRLDSLQVPVTRSAIDPGRSPLSLSLVGRSTIQDARPTTTLDEALAGVPGLVVSNRYSFSLGPRIIMRGMGARAAFGVRGVRVLVDGIPLTMPDGQTNLNNLDLGSAGSIHVLRGPASALFGNAAGGVIAVETEPAPAGFAAEARLITGDMGRGELGRFRKAQGKVGQTVGRTDYVASFARLHVDGYRDHGRTRQSLFNLRSTTTVGSGTRLGVLVSAIDMPVADNPGALPLDQAVRAPTAAWPNNVATRAGETTRQVQAGVRLRHDRQASHLDVALYGISRSLENALPFGFIDLDRQAGGMRALYEHSLRTLPAAPVFTVGLDVELQRDDRREFANDGGRPAGAPRRDQEDRVTGTGPFVQASVGSGPLSLTAGARYDAVRFEVRDRRGVEPDRSGGRTLGALSSMLGATWAVGPATIFGNVASAFQTPTTTELINAPPGPGEPCCPAGFNRDLEPQRALSGEVGVRGSAGAVTGAVTIYRMDVTDALVPFQVPEVEGRDFFRNAARTRHQGAEVSAGVRPHRAVHLNAAYTYADVRFRADGSVDDVFRGNRLPGVPAHRTHVAAEWRWRGTLLGADIDHTGRQYTNDANTTAAPGVTRLDLRAQASLRHGGAEVAPFIALNNVFDAAYFGSVSVNATGSRYYEPAPGRNVYLGASIRTGGWRR